MSTALYRRYRPETFAEMIGQEHVTGPLSAALGKNRVNHAYLFSGPRGCGKTTSARILARCLNCEQGPTPAPCGVCESCVGLARGGGGTLDVIEIDAASHRGIDDAREIRDRAAFAPASSRYKIFIIDEAHQVTKEGFNALLKIVEEPPEHVKFVFATTEPDKVIGTIRSRTHHYPFRLVPPGQLTEYLGHLCEAEQVPVTPDVLPLVVRAGGGSVRDSLSVLDQLIAGAGEEGLTYELAVSLLGYTDDALLDSVVNALAAGDGATVFQVVDRVVESGHDPRRFVEDLLQRLRDLVVVDAVPDGAAAVLRGTPADQLERMRLQAAAYGRAALSRAADIVNLALTEMTGATSPRLQLELLCARLLLPGADDGERGLRARMDRIERRVGGPGIGAAPAPGHADLPAAPARPPAAPPVQAPVPAPVAAPSGAPAQPARSAAEPAEAPVPAAPAAPTSAPSPPAARPTTGDDGWPAARRPGEGPPPQQPSAPPAAPAAADAPVAAPAAGAPAAGPGGGDVDRVRATWPQVLDDLSRRKRATWTLLSQHAQVLDFDGQRLLLGFSSSGLAASFGRGGHQEFLRQSLIEVLAIDCRFEAVSDDAPRGSAGGAARAPQSRPAQGRTQPSAPQQPAAATGAAPASAPAPRTAPSAPPAPAPQGSGREAAPSAGGPQPGPAAGAPSRVPTSAPSADGVPWPDEPPPDFEPPPEDAGRPSRRSQPGSAPSGATSSGATSSGAPSSGPPASGAAPSGADAVRAQALSGAEAARAQARQAARGGGPSRGQSSAPSSSAPTGAAAAAAPAATEAGGWDDEPSRDDVDVKGSGLVGTAVVEQLLGGMVIEEREE